MRTLGIIIKTCAVLLASLLQIVATLAGLKWLAVCCTVAVFLLFTIQSAEVFLCVATKEVPT